MLGLISPCTGYEGLCVSCHPNNVLTPLFLSNNLAILQGCVPHDLLQWVGHTNLILKTLVLDCGKDVLETQVCKQQFAIRHSIMYHHIL